MIRIPYPSPCLRRDIARAVRCDRASGSRLAAAQVTTLLTTNASVQPAGGALFPDVPGQPGRLR